MMADYRQQNNLICLGDPKQGALFFDRMLPVSYLTQCLFEGFSAMEAGSEANCFRPLEPHRKVLLNLMNPFPPVSMFQELDRRSQSMLEFLIFEMNALLASVSNEDALKQLIRRFEQYTRAAGTVDPKAAESAPEDGEAISCFIIPTLKGLLTAQKPPDEDSFLRLLAATYLAGTPGIRGQGNFRAMSDLYKGTLGGNCPALMPAHLLDRLDAHEDDVTVTLANLPLVDTAKADWQQILEFRNDPQATRKLRSLRLFLFENYAEKPPAFIEDDLNRRLEDFQNTCRDWGFETRPSVLSFLMDSKGLRATIGTTLALLLFGVPLVPSNFALGGTSVEMGKVLLHITTQVHAFHTLKRDHPLAYLIEAE